MTTMCTFYNATCVCLCKHIFVYEQFIFQIQYLHVANDFLKLFQHLFTFYCSVKIVSVARGFVNNMKMKVIHLV